MAIVSRSSQVLADLIVIAVTWVKTFGHIQAAWKAGARVSVSATLLRDGENSPILLSVDYALIRHTTQVAYTSCESYAVRLKEAGDATTL